MDRYPIRQHTGCHRIYVVTTFSLRRSPVFQSNEATLFLIHAAAPIVQVSASSLYKDTHVHSPV